MRFRYFATTVTALTAVVTFASPASAASQSATSSGAEVLPIAYRIDANAGQVTTAVPASETSPPTAQSAPAAVDPVLAKWRATQRNAHRWEIAFLALSAIDAVQTIECLDRNACTEMNPLLGKHPSAGKILLFKGGLGLAHYLLFNELNKKDPKAALRAAQFGVVVQGGVVALNTRFMF